MILFVQKSSVNRKLKEDEQFKDSFVLRIYLLEREEVMKLKWIESEKAKKDVGWTYAFRLWNANYRSGWLTYIKAKLLQEQILQQQQQEDQLN